MYLTPIKDLLPAWATNSMQKPWRTDNGDEDACLISTRGMSGGCSDWASFDNGCDCDVSSSVLKEEEEGLLHTSQEVSPGYAFSPAFVFLQSTPKFLMRLDNASQHSTVQSTFRSTIRREISVSKSLANYRRHSTILVPDSLTRVHHCIGSGQGGKVSDCGVGSFLLGPSGV
jgi:hypothetical protein